jgi:hypothetical protein
MSKLLNIVAAMGFLVGAQSAGTARPELPESLTAPAGEQVVLWAHAKGVQIYACQAGADLKLTWVLKGPEAELADASGKTIVHHSAGPTWKHADGSEVMGKVEAKENAPKTDAIPWLLLSAAGHKGEGVFSRVTSIQRIHTEGGLPPGSSACNDAAKGKEVRSAYEADYYFYAQQSK